MSACSAPILSARCLPDGVNRRRRTLCLAAVAAGWAQQAQAQASLQVLLPDDVLQDYRRYLDGRAPMAIDQYASPHARRDVVEVLLLQQALALQAPGAPQTLSAMPTSARLQRELETGRGLCSGTSYWRADFPRESPGLLFSDAIVRDGEFEAGLYAMPDNLAALRVRTLAELRHLRVLSNRDWKVDWQTLQQLGIEQLMHVGSWNLMPRMIASGRADVLLAPFQATRDLSLTVGGVRLVPIEGLKIAMRGSRHYLISRQHPQGAMLKTWLDAGLAQLRQQGAIERAYRASGFFAERTAGWLTL